MRRNAFEEAWYAVSIWMASSQNTFSRLYDIYRSFYEQKIIFYVVHDALAGILWKSEYPHMLCCNDLRYCFFPHKMRVLWKFCPWRRLFVTTCCWIYIILYSYLMGKGYLPYFHYENIALEQQSNFCKIIRILPEIVYGSGAVHYKITLFQLSHSVAEIYFLTNYYKNLISAAASVTQLQTILPMLECIILIYFNCVIIMHVTLMQTIIEKNN